MTLRPGKTFSEPHIFRFLSLKMHCLRGNAQASLILDINKILSPHLFGLLITNR